MASPQNDLRAVMTSTLKTFLENYELAVQKQDTSYMSSKLTSDCTRHLAPASFPATFSFVKSAETNKEYEERMRGEIAMMESTRLNILALMVDPVERKGSAHAEHWTKFHGHEGITLEICWFVDFTADGQEISRIVEFIDTAAAAKMVEAMTKEA